MIDDFFYAAAKIATATKDMRHQRVGAVAIRNRDNVVVRAANGPSTVVLPGAHAESRVLTKAGKNAVLYVARVRRVDGQFGMARPCAKCESLMRNHCVQKCYYTIDHYHYGIMTFDGCNFIDRVKYLPGNGIILENKVA